MGLRLLRARLCTGCDALTGSGVSLSIPVSGVRLWSRGRPTGSAVSATRRTTMLETPQITQTPDQLTAFIRLTVPREEIRNVMGPGIREVMATVAAQGLAPTGPWFTHHLRMDPEVFDFEICVPVDAPVAPAGRVQPGSL